MTFNVQNNANFDAGIFKKSPTMEFVFPPPPPLKNPVYATAGDSTHDNLHEI